MKTTTLLFAATLLALPALGHGQALEQERFTVRASAFESSGRIQLGADGRLHVDELPFDIAWGADGEIRERATRPHLQATWRFADRHRLRLGYYQTGGGEDYRFSDSFDLSGYDAFFDAFDEFIGEYRDASGSLTADARVDVDFQLAHLMYEFALLETPQWAFAVAAGMTWADLEGVASAEAQAEFNGDMEEFSATYQWRRTRWSPTLGMRVAYAPTPAWRFSAEAQGFLTQWGGDFISEDGHFERFGLVAEYRFSRNLGVHAGYDWFRLKLANDIRGGFAGNELRYTGRARGDLRVHGPTVGLTLAF